MEWEAVRGHGMKTGQGTEGGFEERGDSNVLMDVIGGRRLNLHAMYLDLSFQCTLLFRISNHDLCIDIIEFEG